MTTPTLDQQYVVNTPAGPRIGTCIANSPHLERSEFRFDDEQHPANTWHDDTDIAYTTGDYVVYASDEPLPTHDDGTITKGCAGQVRAFRVTRHESVVMVAFTTGVRVTAEVELSDLMLYVGRAEETSADDPREGTSAEFLRQRIKDLKAAIEQRDSKIAALTSERDTVQMLYDDMAAANEKLAARIDALESREPAPVDNTSDKTVTQFKTVVNAVDNDLETMVNAGWYVFDLTWVSATQRNVTFMRRVEQPAPTTPPTTTANKTPDKTPDKTSDKTSDKTAVIEAPIVDPTPQPDPVVEPEPVLATTTVRTVSASAIFMPGETSPDEELTFAEALSRGLPTDEVIRIGNEEIVRNMRARMGMPYEHEPVSVADVVARMNVRPS
jgi:hypothetical protein